MLNIDHIPHAMPYAVVFYDVLMCPYLEKGGYLGILVIDVELITFIGYKCAIYRNLVCGVRNTLALR